MTRQQMASRLRELASCHKTWTTKEENEWNTLCADYDRQYAAEMVNNGNRHLIGRDGASLADGPANAAVFGATPTDDLAICLASWARNACGVPVPAAEFDRSVSSGFDPRSTAFQLQLPSGPPTLGLQFAPRASQSSQLGSAGGFTVGHDVLSRLESAMKMFGPMLRTSEVWITPNAWETAWPTCDDTSNTGSQIGESDESTEVALTFGATKFYAYKFTGGLIKCPHELLRDSAIMLASAIADKMGERLGRIINTRCTTGTGAGTVKGLLTDATVGKTATSTTAVTFDELIDLVHSVDPAYRAMPSTGWQMNDTTAASIAKLKDGDGAYLWRESTRSGEPSTLLGYPVFINQDLADMAASAKPILFGDLSKYKIRIVVGPRFRTLTERYAELDETGFLAFQEIDGKLLKPSATASLCPVRALQMAA